MSATDETEVKNDALDSHTSGLKSRLSDGKYTDLTIQAGARKWRVHKIIVCSGCEFFARACDGGFQEATSSVIDMPEDNPNAVNALLEYLYSREFTRPQDTTESEGFAADTKLLVAVYALADKYLVQSLKLLAEKRFRAAMEDANIDVGIPIMVDEIEDLSGEEMGHLQAMLIDHIAGAFPTAFSFPAKFVELHRALAKKPMLAYKTTLLFAVKRAAAVTRYQCDSTCPSSISKLCSPYGNGIDLPKDMYLKGLRCPWTHCGGPLTVVSPNGEGLDPQI